MNRTILRLFLCLAMAAPVGLGASACSTRTAVIGGLGAAAVGVYMYDRGSVSRVYGAQKDQVEAAVRAVLRDYGAVVTDYEPGYDEAQIDAEGPGGNDFEIEVERASATATEVSVRIGTIGDKSDAIDFHNRLERKLFGRL